MTMIKRALRITVGQLCLAGLMGVGAYHVALALSAYVRALF